MSLFKSSFNSLGLSRTHVAMALFLPPLQYFTAVVLFDLLPLRILPPALFAFVSYPMIGLRGPGIRAWAHTLLALILHNVTRWER